VQKLLQTDYEVIGKCCYIDDCGRW